jgi:hypothetical protein
VLWIKFRKRAIRGLMHDLKASLIGIELASASHMRQARINCAINIYQLTQGDQSAVGRRASRERASVRSGSWRYGVDRPCWT